MAVVPLAIFFNFNSWSHSAPDQVIETPYKQFVTDAADIVHGAKIFIWSNFAQHDMFVIWIKIAPHNKQFAIHDTIACHVEQ